MQKTDVRAHWFRGLDLIAASPALLIAIPVLAVCAIVIRLTSPGPALFAQQRVGAGERRFTCYKLRTMRQDTQVAASHEIGASAVTGVGRFLRASKLDELPQLWNVVVGEMSLVGPRPCLPMQQELIEARRLHHVFSVRPGITGLAQVQGIDMSDPGKLAVIDGKWVRERSLALYLRTILQTAGGRGQGDRVRRENARTPS